MALFIGIYNLIGHRSVRMRRTKYTPLEYIEGTGTQYIDTGIIFSGLEGNAEVKIKFNPTSPGPGQCICGAEKSGNLWTFIPSLRNANMIAFYQGSSGSILPYSIVAGSDFVLDMKQLNGEFSVTMNGATGSYSTSPTFVNRTYVVFGDNTENYGVNQFFKGRIYYIRLYKNNNTVCYLVPAKDDNGIVCMYDKVSKQFFYNQGTGDFIPGPEL